MPLTEVVSASTAVISLTSELLKLIEEAKEVRDGDPSVSELLDELRGRATGLSERFSDRLRRLSDDLEKWGLDTAMPIDDLLRECKWYNWVTRSRLNAVKDGFLATHRQLALFLDDVTALLLCAGEGLRAGTGFRAALNTKRMLDEIVHNRNLPIGELLKEMANVADEMRVRLQGG